jgi:[protein-PII] uridylyltransferase
LIEDIRAITSTSEGELELVPKVVQTRSGQTWIRFHAAIDRAGLFLSYVSRLSGNGLSIRHASIHTDRQLGVYDWFEVKTSKTAAQVRKLLGQTSGHQTSSRRFEVRFDSIELISQDREEWVISFRGRDQQGALLEAARALFECGVQVRWSKVHTWGRQIDDVFGVFPLTSEPNHLIAELKKDLSLTKAVVAPPSVVSVKLT